MRYNVFLVCLFSSFTIYGSNSKPCQVVGFKIVAEHAIPIAGNMASAGISDYDRKKEMRLLTKCINRYSVCIVEVPPKNTSWLSKKLVQPSNNTFDPVDSRLVFGMIQYVDKTSGASICIVAHNSNAQAVPWLGSSWIIDGKQVKEYEFWGDRFNTVMTPKSLYKALLISHEEAMRDNKVVRTFVSSN